MTPIGLYYGEGPVDVLLRDPLATPVFQPALEGSDDSAEIVALRYDTSACATRPPN